MSAFAPTPVTMLDHYGACTAGVEWASEARSLDALWASCPHAQWLVWTTGRLDELGFVRAELPLRRFAVECVRRVEALLLDPRSREALAAAARVAEGRAGLDSLDGAWKGARDAVRDGRSSPTWCASIAAATTAAAHLVRPRASDGAWEVSRQVQRAVAWHPGAEVTVEVEEQWQIALLHSLLDESVPQSFSPAWERYLTEIHYGER